MPPSRRDDLIEAAMRVFSRLGFHGTCLDKVLEEGGISRMTLYNHFRSKDELIVAALRRRDETFRNRMMRYVEAKTADPVERLLAVFDYLATWFEEDDFHGCMFINASAEFSDPDSPVRHLAAEHKRELVRYLRTQCDAGGLDEPAALADQIGLLLDGATVAAHLGRGGEVGSAFACAAQCARAAASALIEAARPHAA